MTDHRATGILERVVILLVSVLVVVGGITFLRSGGPDHADASVRDGSSSSTTSGGGYVDVEGLPGEARATIGRIDAGGPFPYSQDGTVFGNREHLLPNQPSGYYHEYTVATPGESERGARRIVQGLDGTLYYTADHYRSFRQVRR